MKCSCGGDTRVVDSRPQETSLRRRRLCVQCGRRFSTLESELPEKTRVPKAVKQDMFLPAEVAERIRKKKLETRRTLEELRGTKEEADIYDDDFDEDIQWTSNL